MTQENITPTTPANISPGRRALGVVAPSVFIIGNIFFLGPGTIYLGNLGEFGISLWAIVSQFLVPACFSLAIFTFIGAILPTNAFKRYLGVLFGVGFMIWFQGNILAWDYGMIGKGAIDWTVNPWRGWVDLSLWLLVLSTMFFAAPRIYRLINQTSLLFLVLQIALFSYNSFQHPELWGDQASKTETPAAIFEFSSSKNVVHIILDELQTDVFLKVVDEDSQQFNNIFRGFTVFRETVGPFPTTVMSIPAIFTGGVYGNDRPMHSFLDSVYRGKTIPNILLEHGFQVDIAAEQSWYSASKATNYFRIPVPYGVARDEYISDNAGFMLNLSLSRHAPHFVKQALYEGHATAPIINIKTDKTRENFEALLHFSQRAFLDDLIHRANVGRSMPVYKFIHLNITHWPMVVDTTCQYAGKILPFTWENIDVQVRCSISQFAGFLERLKELGIYDSSLIIINADHGYWKIPNSLQRIAPSNAHKEIEKDFNDEEGFAQKVSAGTPLLAIKLPGDIGPMRISDAPVALTDLPATLNQLLDLGDEIPGQSVFELNGSEWRERSFYYYYDLPRAGDQYFPRLERYRIIGPVRDRTSWQYLGNVQPPGESLVASKINFGTRQAAPFLGFGWSYREIDPNEEGLRFSWAIGNSSSIYVSLPRSTVTLTANVKSLFPVGEQLVDVIVDGIHVGQWANSKWSAWEAQSVIIPSNSRRPPVSKIEFRFSDTIPPKGVEHRRLALLFESIIFTTKD